jgi:hypothetical protein
MTRIFFPPSDIMEIHRQPREREQCYHHNIKSTTTTTTTTMTMTTSRAWVLFYWLSCAVLSVESFVASSGRTAPRPLQRQVGRAQPRFAFYDETGGSGPSDSADAADKQDTKQLAFDEKEEDDKIRDALKRELLLFSSVTNRGEYASEDEQVRSDFV